MANVVKVAPDDLTRGFERLGLRSGQSVMLHASLESMGEVDGGAAMVIHRLLHVIGKSGTLLMPTFTSVTRHSFFHIDFTREGCWCEGKEDRHLPFLPELQPDKEIGAIAFRLCSWPSSQRSRHPSHSYVAVGSHRDELVREVVLDDPLFPIRRLLKYEPRVVTLGVGFSSVTSIHLAEEKQLPSKLVKERALTFSSKGPAWVEVRAFGCSNGFDKLRSHIGSEVETERTKIGMAEVESYSLRGLVDSARSLLEEDPNVLSCDRPSCLSCHR